MCVFCKIVSGEIPSYKVYEDENFLAFLDISQASIGHTLVIPKKHFTNILEADDETLAQMFQLVAKLAKQISQNLEVAGFNILSNTGLVAGQTVDHFHVHILPRYENDAVVMKLTPNHLSESEMQTIRERIIRK
ncbi:MAG: HIT family protein [Bacilli bacterium]